MPEPSAPGSAAAEEQAARWTAPPPAASPPVSAPASAPAPAKAPELVQPSQTAAADSAPTAAADDVKALKRAQRDERRALRRERREARREERRLRKLRKQQPLLPPGPPAPLPPPPPPSRAEDLVMVGEAASPDDRYDDWGRATYLSNDDTMSLSSAQRVIYAIDNALPLPPEHVRPHELLNYFSFEVPGVDAGNDFAVLPGIADKPGAPGTYALSLSVRGWPVDKLSRRSVALTVVLDRSGSMREEGRMDYLKRGLSRMLAELRSGDLLNVVIFDHQVCAPIENFAVGRDPDAVLRDLLARLRPRGNTDLHAGLTQGYALADRSYRPTYSNRVLLITDAEANSGETREDLISIISRHYDARRIRLSGVGVGRTFNDSLLDRLTERGRGAYVFLGSAAEVDAVFGERFLSLVETTALDVHFKLHLPPSLRLDAFYGEEASQVKEEVQSIHYFANTSQLFLQDVMARSGALREDDTFMLGIEYEDPESGQEQVEEYVFRLGEVPRNDRNTRKAGLVVSFAEGLAWLAGRESGRAGREDPEAHARCERGRNELAQRSAGIEAEPEVRRVLELWDRYCARFFPARQRWPVRPGAPADSWPGASG